MTKRHRIIVMIAAAGSSIAVTAFPLFARANDFVGAVAIFWEENPSG